MANTYKWLIEKLDCYPNSELQTDVVCNVHWRCLATDTATPFPNTVSLFGICPITYVSGSPFTFYSSLTESIVLGWIWENGVNQTNIQVELDSILSAIENPTITSQPLPWGN